MNATEQEVLDAQELLRIALTTPKELADVFVWVSGHCGVVDVNIHKWGWKEDTDPTFKGTAYFSPSGLAETQPVSSLLTWTRERLAEIEATPKPDKRTLALEKAEALEKQAANLRAELAIS